MSTLARSPIPLRPDRDALRERAMTSLARACLDVGRRALDRNAGSALGDDRVAQLLLTMRSAVSTTTLADAAALAHVAMYFLAGLMPVSAAAAVIGRSLQLNFDDAAQLSIPTLTLPNAAWVSEGQAIPVVQGLSSAGPALIVPHSLKLIVGLTGEMIRNSNAEAFARQVLLENVGPTLDLAMFSAAAAVDGLSPAGILNGVAALAASSAATPLDAMVEDIAAIASALAPVSGGSPPVLIAAPAQAVALALRSPRELWPVFQSAAVPDGTVIGIVPAALATVIGSPRIEAGNALSVHSDDVPSAIVDLGGVSAAPVRSFWQTDSVALRLVLPATWASRSQAAVQLVSGTKW
jgi:hypothetical protein